MNFGPKRAHVLSIFDNFIKDFGLAIAALVISIVMGSPDFLLDNIPVLVIVCMGPFGRLFGYLFTRYTIDSEKLVKESSFIYKKRLEIPISTITTVDVSQNVIQQVLKIYALHIDNASNISDTSSKINVTFGKADMELVRSLLISGREGMDGLNPFSDATGQSQTATGEQVDGQSGSTYTEKTAGAESSADQNKIVRIPVDRILLYGLLESKGVAFLELFTAACVLFSFVNVTDDAVDSAFSVVDRFIENNSLLIILAVVAILLIVLITLIAVGKSFIKYFDFKIYDNGKALKISYGILDKKNYTIQKNRITGFYYQQSFLMKIMNVGVLKVFAIGYGGRDEEANYEDPLIFPLLKKCDLEKTMNSIIPEIGGDFKYVKPEKKSFRYFFYNFSFIASLVILAGLIVTSLLVEDVRQVYVIGILLVVLAVVSTVLRYRNTGLCGNENTISLSFGGFNKTTIFVKTNSVESVKFRTSYFKKKKGIGHVEIGHIAPLITATHQADNLTVESYDEIRNLLIY